MKNIDPRHYQLIVQISLLVWGLFALGFALPWQHAASALVAATLAQLGMTRLLGLPANLLSTANTTMSILLLLHASSWMWIALAAVIAVLSKYIVRIDNKHLFNPSNIGIVAVLLLTDSAWAAPGQWGQGIWFALLAAGCGLIALLGVSRMSGSMTFLGVYAGLLLSRAVWLGDPLSIPLHQLQNGALLIFTFFMLSDPMTTPHHRGGQVIFGIWVAVLAWVLQFLYYIPNAFLYALAFSMPFVPLLNRYLPGLRYQWTTNGKYS